MKPTCSQPPMIATKGTPEWSGWVRALAWRRRLSIAALLDHCLAEYAERHSEPPPPPRWPMTPTPPAA